MIAIYEYMMSANRHSTWIYSQASWQADRGRWNQRAKILKDQTSQANSPVRKRLLRCFRNRSFYWFLNYIVGRRHLVDKRQRRNIFWLIRNNDLCCLMVKNETMRAFHREGFCKNLRFVSHCQSTALTRLWADVESWVLTYNNMYYAFLDVPGWRYWCLEHDSQNLSRQKSLRSLMLTFFINLEVYS